jgi:nitrate reductase NapD
MRIPEMAVRGEELHIASLVVHATPRRVTRVGEAVAALRGALVHAASPNGKLVVTLEAADAGAMAARVADIQHIDGVLGAALVYQCADSLAAMNEEMPDAQA